MDSPATISRRLGAVPRDLAGHGRALAVAALGMTVPVLAGLALGRPQLGFSIGLGAMLLAAQPAAPGAVPVEGTSPGSAVGPALVAVVVATAITGAPWTDPAMIAVAGAAALVSGYSRPFAVAAIRFLIYLVLSVGLLDAAGGHRGGAALAFGAGALWNIVLRVTLARGREAPPPAAPTRVVTPAQRRAHWRRTLRTLAGWQFPIRVVAGLALASVVRHLWPAHHYFWIILTVALLTQRPIERLPTKLVERAGGTIAGVALTWVILREIASPLALGVLICVLGTAAAMARSRSYLAYAAFATPVILLVLDLGKPIATALLTDRLMATLIGAAIVIAGNLAFARVLPAEVAPAGARRRGG